MAPISSGTKKGVDQGSRISQTAFTAVIFAALAFAVLAVTTKIVLRFRWASRPSFDDGVLVASVVFLTASVALIYHSLDLIYSIFQLSAQFDPEKFLEFSRLVDASAVLSWTTIALVKMSFIAFFYPLTDRLYRMRVLWWVVCALTAPCALINMFVTFYICSPLTLEGILECGVGVEGRVAIYIDLTAILDILSDVLILSIPISLLWKVRMDIRRKLGLAAMLCLSAVMIAIQIVRASLGFIVAPALVGPPDHQERVMMKQIDQSWMFFWLTVESAIAIIMVSVTAFKSMLGDRPASHIVSSGQTNGDTLGSIASKSSKLSSSAHAQSSWDERSGHPYSNIEMNFSVGPTCGH